MFHLKKRLFNVDKTQTRQILVRKHSKHKVLRESGLKFRVVSQAEKREHHHRRDDKDEGRRFVLDLKNGPDISHDRIYLLLNTEYSLNMEASLLS